MSRTSKRKSKSTTKSIKKKIQLKSEPNRSKKEILYLKQNGKCAYCMKHLQLKQCTIEHIIPKSKGGPNGIENNCITCRGCNNKAGNDMNDPKRIKIILEQFQTLHNLRSIINTVSSKYC